MNKKIIKHFYHKNCTASFIKTNKVEFKFYDYVGRIKIILLQLQFYHADRWMHNYGNRFNYLFFEKIIKLISALKSKFFTQNELFF